MKMRYDKEDDVLMLWLSNTKVDYAEQEKNVIIHFSKENKPVLLEILNASAFMTQTSKVFPEQVRQKLAS